MEHFPMIRRTSTEWKSLIQEQQASGLNQAQFCQERNICPRYFSVRKKQLMAPGKATPGFIKIERVAAQAPTPTVTLRCGPVELVFHQPVKPDYLLALIRSLS